MPRLLCFSYLYFYITKPSGFTKTYRAQQELFFIGCTVINLFFSQTIIQPLIAGVYFAMLHPRLFTISDNNEVKEEVYAWGVGSGGGKFGTN